MSALDAIVLLASELPDPGSPSFATYCATFGGFVGALVSRVRRCPDQAPKLTAQGIFLGFGIGFLCWATVVAIDRL